MENATKALIFVASVLIAVMLFAFMFFMFRQFSNTARNTEERMSQSEIDAFNSKFSVYDTDGKETVTITHVSRTVGVRGQTKDYTYTQIFGGALLSSSKKDYYKALVVLSQSLNTPVDLVTAINDAIDVNYQNNRGYLYNEGKLEIQNSVEIIVDLKSTYTFKNSNDIDKTIRYLVIEPNKSVKAKYVYGTNIAPAELSTNTKSKEQNVETKYSTLFTDDNAISVYKVLEKFRDTEVIPKAADMAASELDRQYTTYQYYFICDVYYNEFTSLVETLKFTLVKDQKFGNR